MNKISFAIFCFLGAFYSHAQVGINNQLPSVTLEITAKATDGSRAEGLIPPKLTGDALKTAEVNNLYGSAQNGTIVFVTTAASAANQVGQTADVSTIGYYYFDFSANKWTKLGGGNNSALNKTGELTSNYTATATDDIILFNNTSTVTLTLPTTGIQVGKRLYISSNNSGGVNFDPPGIIRNTTYNFLNAGTSATLIFLGGSQWDVVSGF